VISETTQFSTELLLLNVEQHQGSLNRCNSEQFLISSYISGTNVTICGCAAASTPPTLFPPPGTPDACLASGPALTFSKNILAFSQVIGSFNYTCHTDSKNNPFADCFNSMAKICNTTDPTWDSTKKANCQTGVNTMYVGMNSWWQAVRKECGQWSWNGYPASSTAASSSNCASANSNLRTNAIYYQKDGSTLRVDSKFTESTNVRLWSKITA
jgi:hypothetical protein